MTNFAGRHGHEAVELFSEAARYKWGRWPRGAGVYFCPYSFVSYLQRAGSETGVPKAYLDVHRRTVMVKSRFMNRSWTPPSRVSNSDSGMLIEIELDGISLSTLRTGVEDGRLIVAGEHKDWGPFELQFDIPPDHKIAEESFTMTKEVLRIELPRSVEPPPPGMTLPVAGADILMKFPRPMLLYCTGCGKHFDIVLTSQEPADYQCPSCGAVQQFGLGKFVDNAIKQSKEMLRRKRGRG